jgi:SAM-dependent methyltransferase
MGLGRGDTAFATSLYEPKSGADTATGRMLAWLSGTEPGRVLVLGVEAELLVPELRGAGHEVVYVVDPDRAASLPADDGLVAARLDDGLPPGVDGPFDAVVAIDALGRVRDTDAFVAQLRTVLRPGGKLLVSVPNFGHWYPRARVLAGRWSYDSRGLLDAGQLRFFTGRDAAERLEAAGFEPRRRETVGLPLEADRSRLVAAIDGLGLSARPTLFAYQYLFEVVNPA